VKTGANGEKQCADVLKINRPDDLSDVADLGLTLAEGKLLLAGLQQEIGKRPVIAALLCPGRMW
jgi:hypothetical protein